MFSTPSFRCHFLAKDIQWPDLYSTVYNYIVQLYYIYTSTIVYIHYYTLIILYSHYNYIITIYYNYYIMIWFMFFPAMLTCAWWAPSAGESDHYPILADVELTAWSWQSLQPCWSKQKWPENLRKTMENQWVYRVGTLMPCGPPNSNGKFMTFCFENSWISSYQFNKLRCHQFLNKQYPLVN